MKKDVIISLCDYTGNWSRPYREAGYTVIQVDLKLGGDAQLWPSRPSCKPRLPREFVDIAPYVGRVKGVLAAPVCTNFTAAASRIRRSDDDMRQALALVDACIRIAIVTKADFWVIENPAGKLRKWLGAPAMTFNPCDFGDPYKKMTCLWGVFNKPKKRPVKPKPPKKWGQGYIAGLTCKWGQEDARTARSATPMGFSRSFYEANH